MRNTIAIQRRTKYCRAIETKLASLGHATNAELLTELQKQFPNLSATTVHRATARLASRGRIAIAPKSKDGSMCYDSNTTPHDHFQCSTCGIIHDTNVKEQVIPILEASIDGCSVSGQLTINGTCKECMKGKNK